MSTTMPTDLPGYSRDLAMWLTRRRNEGATPDEISRDLVAQGWDVDNAARTSLRSLRDRDRHRLLYSALCWGAGLTALGVGSALHLALTEAPDPSALAFFITLALVAGPIGLFAGVTAREVETAEPHAIWSPSRRVLFATLAATTATVGIFRLLHYTFNLVASLVGADGYDFTSESVAQVIITLALSVPLFWWSLTEWRRSNVARRTLVEPAGTVRR